MMRILKIIWALCAVAVLAVTLTHSTPQRGNDIGVFLAYGMLFLTFPAGLLVAGLIALIVIIQEQLGVPLLDAIGSTYVGYFVLWLAFFIAGYLQWFVLVPFLLRKWKGAISEE